MAHGRPRLAHRRAARRALSTDELNVHTMLMVVVVVQATHSKKVRKAAAKVGNNWVVDKQYVEQARLLVLCTQHLMGTRCSPV